LTIYIFRFVMQISSGKMCVFLFRVIRRCCDIAMRLRRETMESCGLFIPPLRRRNKR